MKTILTFAGTSHRNSINLQLANYAAKQINGATLKTLDLNDFEMPLYSEDREKTAGIPQEAHNFLNEIQSSDAIVLSLAEHNGSYTAAFKNLLDWTSRIEQKLWSDKPMFLLATSPGDRGATTVLEAANQTFPHLGADIKGAFSLPSFYDNFSEDTGITNSDLKSSLASLANRF